MVFISIFMLLLLIGVTLWLWRLSQAQFIYSAVSIDLTSFVTTPSMTVGRSVNKLSFRLKEAVSFLWKWFDFLWESYQISKWEKTTEALPLRDHRILRYSGRVNLPKKVYEGDSQNISLILDRVSSDLLLSLKPLKEILKIEDTAVGKQVTLDIQEKDNSELSLEVKLLAPEALSIGGEKIQKKPLRLETLAYLWNFQFERAGKHEICLVLNVIHPSGERYLGRIEQTIQVVKFDHATQRQVQMGAAITGAVTLLGGIATFLVTTQVRWGLAKRCQTQ